jgi:hypothetical protein
MAEALVGHNPYPLSSRIRLKRDRGTRIQCAHCRNYFTPVRVDAITCSERCRRARSRRLLATTPDLPAGRFDLVYADPPWSFLSRTPAGQEPIAALSDARPCRDLPNARRLYRSARCRSCFVGLQSAPV